MHVSCFQKQRTIQDFQPCCFFLISVNVVHLVLTVNLFVERQCHHCVNMNCVTLTSSIVSWKHLFQISVAINSWFSYLLCFCVPYRPIVRCCISSFITFYIFPYLFHIVTLSFSLSANRAWKKKPVDFRLLVVLQSLFFMFFIFKVVYNDDSVYQLQSYQYKARIVSLLALRLASDPFRWLF